MPRIHLDHEAPGLYRRILGDQDVCRAKRGGPEQKNAPHWASPENWASGDEVATVGECPQMPSTAMPQFPSLGRVHR